jgi:hypothetical protein
MGQVRREVEKALGIHLFLRVTKRWLIVRVLVGGMLGAFVGMCIGVGIAAVFAPVRRPGDIPTRYEWYIFMYFVGAFWGGIIGGISGGTAGLFRSWADRAYLLSPSLAGAALWMAISLLSYEQPLNAADHRADLALRGFIFGGALGFLAGLVLVPIMRYRVFHY